jgi:hypothetical protein
MSCFGLAKCSVDASNIFFGQIFFNTAGEGRWLCASAVMSALCRHDLFFEDRSNAADARCIRYCDEYPTESRWDRQDRMGTDRIVLRNTGTYTKDPYFAALIATQQNALAPKNAHQASLILFKGNLPQGCHLP